MPILAALASIYLMLNLKGETWLRFVIWMASGLIVYFVYGRRNSRFSTPGGREDARAANAARRA